MQETRTAIYPGTFDPLTNGHLDIIERARRCFPQVVVAVSQQPGKVPLFALEERVALAKEVLADLDGVEVDTFDGLLVDHVRRRDATIVVKGLRGTRDFDYEGQMALMNQHLAGVETVFLVAGPATSFISSTLVKEVARFGGDIDALVPPEVARKMKERSSGEA